MTDTIANVMIGSMIIMFTGLIPCIRVAMRFFTNVIFTNGHCSNIARKGKQVAKDDNMARKSFQAVFNTVLKKLVLQQCAFQYDRRHAKIDYQSRYIHKRCDEWGA